MALTAPLGRGFAERIPLVLVLDTSASMASPAGSPRIAELNAALREWIADAAADPALRERLEIAIVTFDSEVRVLHLTDAPEPPGSAFALAAAVTPPELCASGLSLMLPALEVAVRLATQRSGELAAANIPAGARWSGWSPTGRPATPAARWSRTPRSPRRPGGCATPRRRLATARAACATRSASAART